METAWLRQRVLPATAVVTTLGLTFTLVVSSAEATTDIPTCQGIPATIEGTPGDDDLEGTEGPDVVVLGAGNDQFDGDDGDDIICGGPGEDEIDGGDGNDIIYGGAGNDHLDGERNNDLLYGEDGDDRLDGGSDNDELHGGTGGDDLNGNSDDDHLHGGPGYDDLSGGTGDDWCSDLADDMSSCETESNDPDPSAPGSTSTTAPPQTTTSTSEPTTVSPTTTEETPEASICDGLTATIVGTENGDVLTGTEGDDVIVGLGGSDVINALGGDDIICGGPGHDSIDGGPGADQIDAGSGSDAAYGKDGNDTIYGRDGDDQLTGDDGDDHIDGGAGYDSLNGGLGFDTLVGDPSEDTISPGDQTPATTTTTAAPTTTTAPTTTSTTAPSTTTTPAPPSSVTTKTFNAGDKLVSSDGRYEMRMQGDGNLVVYRTSDQHALWSSRTDGHAGAHARMQGDGNLVVYSSGGNALWASGTNQGAATLRMQGDGNLVIYRNGTAVWATNTVDTGGSSGSGNSLGVTLYENPFVCDGATRSLGRISGATPGETIRFTSPQVGGLLPGPADGSGNLTMIWNCNASEVGTTWQVTARGDSSGRTVSFALGSAAASSTGGGGSGGTGTGGSDSGDGGASDECSDDPIDYMLGIVKELESNGRLDVPWQDSELLRLQEISLNEIDIKDEIEACTGKYAQLTPNLSIFHDVHGNIAFGIVAKRIGVDPQVATLGAWWAGGDPSPADQVAIDIGYQLFDDVSGDLSFLSRPLVVEKILQHRIQFGQTSDDTPRLQHHNMIIEVWDDPDRAVNPSFLAWDGRLYHIGATADYWDCYAQVGGNPGVVRMSRDEVYGWVNFLDWADNVDRCW